ncbi:hypothetical protein GCM10011391_31390 [Pullulanibacillus camelliae]|uniref:Uncharacterized protein n=1 Tax=Pullulanibacillus camelliae TaxID=1707096 RepID=A0A8J2YKZ6_9BACL|nr:hypothetical protein GCM10011391_31390 [Pullulanibacillus camelliae]
MCLKALTDRWLSVSFSYTKIKNDDFPLSPCSIVQWDDNQVMHYKPTNDKAHAQFVKCE